MNPSLCGSGDVDRLALLHAACFTEGWTAGAIASLVAAPGCFAFATADGFIIARAAAGEAEILTLAVTPAARRKGLGRALVAAAAGHAQGLGAEMMFLEVARTNAPAIGLYYTMGFAQVAERKAYYGGTDALVMKAALPLARNIA